MSCCVVPLAMLGLVGVTAMDTSVAAVTVRIVEPDMLPLAAVMVAPPVPTLVAKPALPEALETAATEEFVDDQVAAAVRS